MLAQERQQQILTLLEERGTLRTVDLAEEFAVTDETIRRDFQTLAEEGQLTRIHGGATTSTGRPKLQSFNERSGRNVAAKQAIARAVVDWIQPGKTYAFDSSTTAFELVKILPNIPFRVVTNAYSVLDRLVGVEQIELVSTGGRYHTKTQTFVGGSSIDSLRRHNVDIAFISSIGLDPQRGASEGFEQQAIFKERLVELAGEVVLLVDSEKLGVRSEYFFAATDKISRVVTDSAADPDIVRQLEEVGIPVIKASMEEQETKPVAASGH